MDNHARLAVRDCDTRLDRRAFALRLHEIEGNPFNNEQVALFSQFDRDGLTDEQRRAVLTARAKTLAAR